MAAFKDITGQRFGRLVALRHEMGPRSKRNPRNIAWWLCRCDCGTEKFINIGSLGSGRSNSCGCLQIELARKRETTHGMCYSSTFRIWSSMLTRCNNPKAINYARYGGRGITVCERWRKFENFLADMGERPEGKTLDRYPNNDGPYEKSNCRWSTVREQSNNKRSNRFLTAHGKTMTLIQWARHLGIHYGTIYNRIRRGQSVEMALTVSGTKSSRTHRTSPAEPR